MNLLSPSSTNLSENKSQKITSTDQAKNIPTEHEKLANCYADASLQLLGMCNTLYAKSASIFKDWEATTKERFAAESDPIQAEQYNSSWYYFFLLVISKIDKVVQFCFAQIYNIVLIIGNFSGFGYIAGSR